MILTTLNGCHQNCKLNCSIHFPDGKPTPINPWPTLNLGYDASKIIKQLTSTIRGIKCANIPLQNSSVKDDSKPTSSHLNCYQNILCSIIIPFEKGLSGM